MSNIGWNFIITEGYCIRKVSEKKGKYIYEVISTDPWKTKKKPNPYYDPKYRTPKKPKYCKDKICYECFENDCPYLGMVKPSDKIYNRTMTFLNNLSQELWDNEEDEVWEDV